MYTIIDIESNGDKFRKEQIIEVAIYKFDGHKIVDQFISLIHLEGKNITPFVQKLTGIKPKMVKTAPKFHEVAKRIIEITDGTTLVGHNVDFDYRMLRQSFKRLGYDFTINIIDTIPLAKKLIPNQKSYSLGKLIKSLGIPMTDRHRAAGDARATVELFKLLLSKDEENEIIQKIADKTLSKSYLNKVIELIEDLPHEKGIIYFQDKGGKILFFSYTDDIFQMAKKVFNSKSKRWNSIKENCEQINYEKAGNALIAQLILDTKGLKKSRPLFYGLYKTHATYLVEKNSLHEDNEPLLKFSSFTQGLKVKNYIESQPELEEEVSKLEELISLTNKPPVWTLEGRNRNERCFLLVENGVIESYGFYEIFSQINSKEKIHKRIIQLNHFTQFMKNEMKLALLRNEITFSSPEDL